MSLEDRQPINNDDNQIAEKQARAYMVWKLTGLHVLLMFFSLWVSLKMSSFFESIVVLLLFIIFSKSTVYKPVRDHLKYNHEMTYGTKIGYDHPSDKNQKKVNKSVHC